jgi:hypothetical protein
MTFGMGAQTPSRLTTAAHSGAAFDAARCSATRPPSTASADRRP